jgi:hypothetical protein
MPSETHFQQQSLPNPQDMKVPDLDFLKTAVFEEVVKIKRSERLVSSFVFTKSDLLSVLGEAASDHRLLKSGGNPFFNFKSQYYDTEQYDLYRNHHNEKLNRWKIKRSENVTSEKLKFEIRFYNNKNKTQRWSLETDNRNNALSKPEKQLVKKLTPFKPKYLINSLCVTYRRFTLLGNDNGLRVTFDTDMQFVHRGKLLQLPQLVVAEVKQSQYSQRGAIHEIFKTHRIHPKNFSKYCIGLALANKQVKRNNFKSTINLINTLSYEYDFNSTIG